MSAITPPNGSQDATEKHNSDGDSTKQDNTPPQDGNHSIQYDTPPRDLQEATSPVSSRKNGSTRAHSLGISPTAGRGDMARTFAVRAAAQIPQSSSSARITKKFNPPPSMLFTTVVPPRRYRSIMEPPITPIGTFGSSSRLAASKLSRHHHLGNVPESFDEAVRSPIFPEFQQAQAPVLRPARDAFDMDPYGHQADEIGLSHGIPGVGHLGDLLPPPGWQRGQAPLEYTAVEALYGEARKLARAKLQQPLLNDTARSKQQDWEWTTQLQLDQLLLKLRTDVYEKYCKRQHGQQERSTLPPPGGKLATPLNSQFPVDAHSLATHQNLPMDTGIDPAWTLQSNITPHSQYMVPNALHPALHTASVTSTLDRFHQENAEVMRRKSEMETNLSSCLTQFRSTDQHGSQSLISPADNPGSRQHSFSSDFNSQTAPQGFSSQTASQGPFIMGPTAYISPRQASFVDTGPSSFMNASYYPSTGPVQVSQSTHYQPAYYQPPSSQPYALYDGANPQPLGVQTPFSRGQTPSENANEDAQHGVIDGIIRGITPTKGRPKKGISRKVSPKKSQVLKAKVKPWYEDSIDRSSMPRAEISETAMAQGLAFVPHHLRGKRAGTEGAPEQSETPKPKRRKGRKEVPDPVTGITISQDMARHLLAAGARNRLGGYQIPPKSPPKRIDSIANDRLSPKAKAELEKATARAVAEVAERESRRLLEQSRSVSNIAIRAPQISNSEQNTAGIQVGYRENQPIASARGYQVGIKEGTSNQANNNVNRRVGAGAQSGTTMYTTALNPANLGIIQFTPTSDQANDEVLQVPRRRLVAQTSHPTVDTLINPVGAQGAPSSSSQVPGDPQKDRVKEAEADENDELSSPDTNDSDPDDADFSLEAPVKPARSVATRRASSHASGTSCASATRATRASGRKTSRPNKRSLRSNTSLDMSAALGKPQQTHDHDRTEEDDEDQMEE